MLYRDLKHSAVASCFMCVPMNICIYVSSCCYVNTAMYYVCMYLCMYVYNYVCMRTYERRHACMNARYVYAY